MANFESFRRNLLPLAPEPHVTIQKRGAISLNKSAFQALGAPPAVELLYDRDDSIVGLRPIDARATNAYHVRATSQSGPYVISAMAFTKFYGIDTTVTLRWMAYMDNGILCVDLGSEATPVTSNRARRRNTGGAASSADDTG